MEGVRSVVRLRLGSEVGVRAWEAVCVRGNGLTVQRVLWRDDGEKQKKIEI
jgi:hypothetical protein